MSGPGGPVGGWLRWGPSERGQVCGGGGPAGQGTRRRGADPPGPTPPRRGPEVDATRTSGPPSLGALDHPPAPPRCPSAFGRGCRGRKGFGRVGVHRGGV